MPRLAVAAVALAAAACEAKGRYVIPPEQFEPGRGSLMLPVQAPLTPEGCWEACRQGTVCNRRTGECESPSADLYCEPERGGGKRCVPVQIDTNPRVPPRPASPREPGAEHEPPDHGG
jgi:hypothetical protein